ncbi:MAG: hypothetical protein ACRCZ2_13650 [Fusobacteriaceae bacterium]
MNRHLSIFNPFSHTGKENNLTRALLILLKKDPLYLSIFLNKITGNYLTEKSLENEIQIDTQRTSSSFNIEEGIEKVYGATLNTRYYNTNILKKNKILEPITDISIQIGEILIIIEVKPHDEDPRAQLNNQMEKLNWGNKSEDWRYVSLIWSDVLNIAISMEKFNKKLNSHNIFLNEFNHFIEGNYPELLPVFPISEKHSLERIERRVKQIEKEINKSLYGPNFQEEIDFIKLKNVSIADRFKIYAEKHQINLFIWPGDSNSQAKILYKKNFNLKKIEYNLKNNLNVKDLKNDENYNVLTHQYISFAHIMGKGVFWEEFESRDDIAEIYYEICGITYKSNEQKWEELKDKISKYVVDKDLFLNQFKESFEKTNRNFVNICVGNCIKLSFDIKYIEKIEKNNKTVEFFREVMDKILEHILYD